MTRRALAVLLLLAVAGCGRKDVPDHWERVALTTGDSAWVFVGDTLKVRWHVVAPLRDSMLYLSPVACSVGGDTAFFSAVGADNGFRERDTLYYTIHAALGSRP